MFVSLFYRLGEVWQLRIHHRLAARYHHISAGPLVYFVDYSRYGEFLTIIGVPGVFRITPFAPNRTARQTNKYAWRSRQQPLSLNRMKNFVYYHFRRAHRPVLNRFLCANDALNVFNRVFKPRVAETNAQNHSRSLCSLTILSYLLYNKSPKGDLSGSRKRKTRAKLSPLVFQHSSYLRRHIEAR